MLFIVKKGKYIDLSEHRRFPIYYGPPYKTSRRKTKKDVVTDYCCCETDNTQNNRNWSKASTMKYRQPRYQDLK